jgi:hypothetical protein
MIANYHPWHFYQPACENPWTGVVDREESAAPYHDWNERVYAECYRPNGFAGIVDGLGGVEGRIWYGYGSGRRQPYWGMT